MITKAILVFLIAFLTQTKAQKREGDSCVEQYTNTVGKCKPADTCESARNDFQLNGITPTFCTYSAFGVTLVCCRDGVSILHTAQNTNSAPVWGSSEPNRNTDMRRVSERNDKENSSSSPVNFLNFYHGHHYAVPKEELPAIVEEKSRRKEQKIDETSTWNDKEVEYLSKIWALKLKKLNTNQRKYAEKLINDILFYAEVEQLSTENFKALQSVFFSCETTSAQVENSTQVPTKEEKSHNENAMNAKNVRRRGTISRI